MRTPAGGPIPEEHLPAPQVRGLAGAPPHLHERHGLSVAPSPWAPLLYLCSWALTLPTLVETFPDIFPRPTLEAHPPVFALARESEEWLQRPHGYAISLRSTTLVGGLRIISFAIGSPSCLRPPQDHVHEQDPAVLTPHGMGLVFGTQAGVWLTGAPRELVDSTSPLLIRIGLLPHVSPLGWPTLKWTIFCLAHLGAQL